MALNENSLWYMYKIANIYYHLSCFDITTLKKITIHMVTQAAIHLKHWFNKIISSFICKRVPLNSIMLTTMCKQNEQT